MFQTTANTIIYVEPIGNFDSSGSQAFSINTLNQLFPPTTYQAFHKIFEMTETNEMKSNPQVIPPGVNVRVNGGSYTFKLKLHVFELPDL